MIMATFKNINMFGFWIDSGDYELRLKTDTLDFGQRGMKMITVIEAGMNYTKSDFPAEVAIEYKYDYMANSFSRTAWKIFNREGIAYPQITASEVRVLIRSADYRDSKASISYITIRLKMSDKRSIRGRFNVNTAIA